MKKTELKRSITFTTGFLTLVGSVIGAGIFFKPAAVFSATQDAMLGLLAWFLSGLVALFGGMSIAELGAMYPSAGGIIVYLEKVYGKTIAYLAGWVQLALYFPGTLAALAIIFSQQLVELFHLSDALMMPIAVLALSFIVVMNLLGTKYSGKMQVILTVLKCLPLLILIIFGLMQPVHPQSFVQATTVTDSAVIRLGGGLLATVFAYDGWLNIGNLAGEIKEPNKNIPRVIILGVGTVTLAYVLVNMAYLFVAPASQLASTATPASFVAQQLFPGIGSQLITVGILISVFGGMNGYTMAAIRVPYALALRNWLPFSKSISRLNPHTQTSFLSSGIIFFIALLLLFTGSFDSLTNLAVVSIYFFTILCFAAVIILRRKHPEMNRPYKVAFYPVVPLLAIAGGAFIILSTLLLEPFNILYSTIITLVGLPLYWYAKKGNKE